ncbi:MAG TPA: CHRD domain-containing protein [Acetobacteraceae bacterium]|nr:CHRD domain-containing protein [Acetobacteraceae bacterium]
MLRGAVLAAVLAAGFLSPAFAATETFHAVMNGKSEVPATTSAGTGSATLSLDTATKELTYTVTFDKLTGPATAAHFHGPAAKGENAGVVVPIGGANPTSPVHGTATLTEAQIKDLVGGKWYVNVHTAANKGGEIRGQVEHGAAPRQHASKAATHK